MPPARVDSPTPLPQAAATMSYPPPAQYYGSSTQYGVAHHGPGHVHLVSQDAQQAQPAQRKRPKYTRSKTGCLTCRVKKVKCDEAKPHCMRCTHGQRECTWPDNVSMSDGAKTTPPRDIQDSKASASDSSDRTSEASGPSLHSQTPPPRAELALPPMNSRRQAEPYPQLPPMLPHSRSSPLVTTGPGVSGYSIGGHDRYTSSSHGPYYGGHVTYDGFVRTGPGVASIPNLVSPASSRPSSSHSTHRPLHHMTTPAQWATPALIPSPDPIEPYFNNVQERNLIRHYAASAANIILADPTLDPVTKANIDLSLSRPAGSDSAVDSLRMAILGAAAIHQSFLLGRSGMVAEAAEFRVLAGTYRKNSKQLLASACTSEVAAQSTATLGATMTIALIDIFNGGLGEHWQRNVNLGKALVKAQGGPREILRKAPRQTRAHTRLFLEMLAVYDVAGSAILLEEATVLEGHGIEWWYEGDGHDFETVFGISRELFPLIAHVIALVSRTRRHEAKIYEMSPDSPSNSMNVIEEAQKLYKLIEDFKPSKPMISPRVAIGNEIYRKMEHITILRDLLHSPRDHEMVRHCVETILTLTLQCARSRMGVVLIWPIVIAGSQYNDPEHKLRVLEILEEFRNQCCYEVDTAQTILGKVWERLDEEHPRSDWRSVVRDHNLNFLLL